MLAILVIARRIIVSGWTSATGGLEVPMPQRPVKTKRWSRLSSGMS